MSEQKIWATSKHSRFLQMWAQTIDNGLVPRVIITSQRHQMGKTASMIRIMEKVQEEIHGRKFSIDDLTLTCLEFMRRRKNVPEWTPLGLDEPERPVGNKSNWDLEAQYFVEDLMTSPFRHVPALFALPHSHFLNVSIYGVGTSQIVKLSKTLAQVYELERDQLNRNFKTYTWLRGSFTLDMPYAWDWKAYMEKRDKFDIARGKLLEDKVARLHSDTRDLDKEQVYLMVKADMKRFMDPKKKNTVTPSQVEAELGVSFASARYAARKINLQQREMMKAEADKLGPSD